MGGQDTRGQLRPRRRGGGGGVQRERVRTRPAAELSWETCANVSRSSGLKPRDEFRGSLTENLLKNASRIKERREDAAASSGLDVNPPSFHLFKTSPAPPKNTLLTGFFFEEHN